MDTKRLCLLKLPRVLFSAILKTKLNNEKGIHIMVMAISSSHTGTHSAPLAISCLNTSGAVLELGCGLYSTLLLHTICEKQIRRLHTVDHTLSWLNKFNHLETDLHTFQHLQCGSLNVTVIEFMYRLSPHWTKKSMIPGIKPVKEKSGGWYFSISCPWVGG